MAITIRARELASRAVRDALTQNGERVLNTDLSFSEFKDTQGGILGFVIDVTRTLSGFLVKGIKSLVQWGLARINFTRAWGWLVSQTTRLASFDWNQTDAEIDQLIANNILSVFATWGSTLGAGAGWLTTIGVGYGVGLGVPVIGGAALAKTIASATTSEAIDELQGYFRQSIQRSFEVTLSNSLLSDYKNFRSLVKRLPLERISGFFGEDTARWIKDVWGTEGAATFSFASVTEEAIERIESDKIRVFVENATEEFVDSFIEGGFIIANELDIAYQQYRMQYQRNGSTTSRAVTIVPDKNEPSQKFYIEGTETEVKQQTQAIVTNARVLGNREVGEWVGQPAEDWLRAKPHQRKATIIYKSVPGKAFIDVNSNRARTAQYTIPDLQLALNWTQIKRATRPYNWGEWRATANLDNGRQMAIYGATGVEAEDKLRELLELSTAKIITLSVSQEKDRDVRVKKRVTRMYPYRLKLLVRRFDPDGSSFFDAEGNAYTDINQAIPLWVDEEPPEFTGTFV